MLLTKEVELKLNGATIQNYEKLGYEIPRHLNSRNKLKVNKNDTIKIKIEDLSKYSKAKVQCLCDYCLEKGINTIIEESYSNYIRRNKNAIIHKDCCLACKPLKTKESNLKIYGSENVFQLDEIKEKSKNTILDKYNVEYISQSKEIQDKVKETNINKFGCEYALQSKKIIQKRQKTLKKNGNIKTSRQQIYLHNLFGGDLNYQDNNTGVYTLDIAFPNEKVYIEYNGGGHNLFVKTGLMSESEFNKKELNRYFYLKRNGWKCVIISSPVDYLPCDDILLTELNNAKKWFLLDIKGHSHYNININNKVNDINYGKLRKITENDLDNEK